MKQNLNEIKRIQQLAGIISESVKVKTKKATDLQFILRDLADAYDEEIGDDKTKQDFKDYTIGQVIEDWKKLKQADNYRVSNIEENESSSIPADVKNLAQAQKTSTTIQNRAKEIDNIQEFSGAFKNWINSLGIQPNKVSKSSIRSEVEKVLTSLGYK